MINKDIVSQKRESVLNRRNESLYFRLFCLFACTSLGTHLHNPRLPAKYEQSLICPQTLLLLVRLHHVEKTRCSRIPQKYNSSLLLCACHFIKNCFSNLGFYLRWLLIFLIWTNKLSEPRPVSSTIDTLGVHFQLSAQNIIFLCQYVMYT